MLSEFEKVFRIPIEVYSAVDGCGVRTDLWKKGKVVKQRGDWQAGVLFFRQIQF